MLQHFLKSRIQVHKNSKKDNQMLWGFWGPITYAVGIHAKITETHQASWFS